MHKNSEKGVVHLLVLLLILVGIVGGVYLVQKQTQLFPKAASAPVGPETSITLRGSQQATVGQHVGVIVDLRSDVESSNLVAIKIKFNPGLVRFEGYSSGGPHPIAEDDWLERYYNNDTGEISFIIAAKDYGFISSPTGPAISLLALNFTTKATGTANFEVLETSEMYSKANNINILTTRRSLSTAISTTLASNAPVPTPIPTVAPTATPVPTAAPTAVPSPVGSPTPAPRDMDLKKDGKLNLADMSAFYTKCIPFNVTKLECDLNADGAVNTFDRNILKVKLIELNILRAQ